MNHRRPSLLALPVRLAFAIILVACHLYAQRQPIPASLTTGQAARFVLGQNNFTDITGGTSQLRWQNISGIAIANNKIIIADSTFFPGLPSNNRVLIYNNLDALKLRAVQGDLPAADVVLGQPTFDTAAAGTSAQLFNQPVGVATDGTRLFIAEWGNNRVLIYNRIPENSGAAADIVIGQPSFSASAATTSAQGLRRPNSVSSDGARMFIADTLNNRILIYNRIPTQSGAAADVVIGQPNFDRSQPLPIAANTLSSPMSATSDGQRLIVTDQANNRVLIFNQIPTGNGVAASVVVGQPDFTSNGAANTQTGLNFPRYAYSDGTRLIIADTGNNRILIYNQIPAQNGAPADVVIGQVDFNGLTESCAASYLAIPYALASDGDMLFVADGLNRRVLGFRPGAPLISQLGVVNNASYSTAAQTQACQVTLLEPVVAPGAIVSIFGNNMASGTSAATSLPLPTHLGGVHVRFNGIDAPIFHVSPSQIDVQVPFEVTGYSGSVEIEKDTASGPVTSAAVAVGLADGAPGIYTVDGSGSGLPLVFHGDGTRVTPDSPAKPGETVALYATGLGRVDDPHAMLDGYPAQFGAQGSVTFGGTVSTGQQATIVINGAQYTYTAVAGNSLDQVVTELAAVINNANDPNATAQADITNSKIKLISVAPGEAGTEVTYSAFVPEGGTILVTVDNPAVVPASLHFSGTPAVGQTVTVNLSGTLYVYSPTAADTLSSVLTNLARQISEDANVDASADIGNSAIRLTLSDPGSGLQVTYAVTVEPSDATLSASVDNPHLLPGVANVKNTLLATVGKPQFIIPGSIFIDGTADAGQTLTVTLSGTRYPYTTTAADTVATVLNNVASLINSDPNVTATADATNRRINLALKDANSRLQITFTVAVTGGTTLLAQGQSGNTTGSAPASIVFAGMVGGYAGLYQVNFTIPSDAQPNPSQTFFMYQNLIVFGSVTGTNIYSNEVTIPIGSQ
jgi:uncharacterized protein (TIGR03437 family)